MNRLHLALAGLLTLSAPAWAQEEPAPPEGAPPVAAPARCPVNPFAEAQVGDWGVSLSSRTGEGREERYLVSFRVVEVDDEWVTIASRHVALGGGREDVERKRRFKRREAPPLGFLVSEEPPPAEEVAVEAAQLDPGDGQPRACHKVGFSLPGPGSDRMQVQLWMAGEAKPLGLLRAEVTFDGIRMENRALGWGTAEGKSWGQTLEEAKAALAGAPPAKD